MHTYETKSLKELISITKEQLIGKYGVAILANLLIGIITLIAVNLTSSLSDVVNAATYFLNIGITLIIDVLTGVLVLGQTTFFLKLVRGENNLKVSDVFAGFKQSTDKAIIIQAIYIAILLVEIIPNAIVSAGIIPISESVLRIFSLYMILLRIVLRLVANLFLALSFYVLADHPDYSIKEILSEATYLMRNRKGRLLLIYLLMIPLGLLGCFSCGVGALFVEAFYETLMANFYLDAIKEEPYRPTTTYSDSTTSDIH